MKIKPIDETTLLKVGIILAKQEATFELASNTADVFEFVSTKGKKMSFASAPVRSIGDVIDVNKMKVTHANVALPNASDQAFFSELNEGDKFKCTIDIVPAKTGNNKSDFDRNSFGSFERIGAN